MPKYSWIALDADGTIFDYDQAELNALTKTFRQYDLLFDSVVRSSYSKINAGLWAAFERGEVSSKDLRVLRFEELGKSINGNFCASQLSDTYLRNLGDQSILLPDAFEVVEKLSQDFGLVLATNGIAEVQRSRFSASGLTSFFSELVISDEIGIAKPDPGFFSELFSRIGDPDREDVLMVGDSLSSDIAGGAGFGIDTCWLNASNEANNSRVEPTFEIEQIIELPLLMKSLIRL